MGDCSFISWLLPFYQIKLSAIYLDGLKFGMNESSDDDDEQINRVSSNIKCFVHLLMTKYNVCNDRAMCNMMAMMTVEKIQGTSDPSQGRSFPNCHEYPVANGLENLARMLMTL